MKQFAIIGMSNFGLRMMEELSQLDCEILIVDKDRTVIEALKDKATTAYVADAISEEIIRKLVPATIDAAIIDLGGRTEVSILVTNYLKKMGVETIIAKAETDEHGEILDIVGATHVVFPNREAAKRITPLLGSSLIFKYMPISNGLVLAEVGVPKKFVGMSLIETRLRETHGLNVVAIRKEDDGGYEFFTPEYRLNPKDILLIVGSEEKVYDFSGRRAGQRSAGIAGIFKNLFSRTR